MEPEHQYGKTIGNSIGFWICPNCKEEFEGWERDDYLRCSECGMEWERLKNGSWRPLPGTTRVELLLEDE